MPIQHSTMAPLASSLLYLLVSLLLIRHGSSATPTCISDRRPDIVADTCELCANGDPNVNYAFCMASLGSVPRSHRSDRRGLAVITLKLAKSNATRVKSAVKKLLKAKPASAYERSCLETCRELYGEAATNLRESIKAVKSGRHKDANVWVSAAVDAPGQCEDSFQDGSITSPLTTENGEFFKLATLALAIITLR